MSTDVANLFIKIDSKGVVTASKNLDELTGKSKKSEKATDSVTKSFQSQIGIVKQLAAAYGLFKIAQYIKDVTLLAARYETLGVVMRTVGNNAGYTGAQMATFQRELEKTGISMTKSRTVLTRMLQAQLDLNKATELGRIAQDAAVIGNINSSEAFERMIYGIQSAQVEMLRTIGINVNFENSYQRIAKETGRVATSFTEAEKAQIRMNTAMKAGQGIAGTYEAAMGTAGKQLLSLERHWENLKVLLGQLFTPALAEIVEAITDSIKDMNQEFEGDGADAIQAWGDNFRLTIIDIEAGLLSIAIALDTIGIAFYEVNKLGSSVGKSLGISKKDNPTLAMFLGSTEESAEYDKKAKEYADRLVDSQEELIKLAEKRTKLEQSLTPAARARAKAEQEAAEAIVIARQKAAAVAQKEDELNQKKKADAESEAKKIREIADAYTALMSPLDETIKRTHEWLEAYDTVQAALEVEIITPNAAKEAMRLYNESVAALDAEKAQRKIDELAEAASYYENLIGFEETYHEKMLKLIEARRQAEINAGQDVEAANEKARQSQNKLSEEAYNTEIDHIKKQWSGYSDMFEGLGQLYSKDSSQRSTLHKAAMAFQIAEQIALTATAIKAAAVAVATQGEGDPYSAFARIAAMIATMASVLGAAGISFSASASNSGATTSTALGSSEQSQSIQNSYKILKDMYDMQYRELTKLNRNILLLGDDITGAVTQFYKDLDLSGGLKSDISSISSAVINFKTDSEVKVKDSIRLSMVSIAENLGVNINDVLNYTFQKVSLNSPNLADSKITEEAINEYFSTISDLAIEDLFGSMVSEYQRLGEGLYETAVRLATDKVVILDTLDMTGQAFSGTIPKIIAFSETLINMAGDLETLRKNAEKYYDKFFSDEEKQQRLQEQLSRAMSDINLELPATRDGYRALVEGLNLSTTAGQEAYVALLEWAESADEYYSVVEDAAGATDDLNDSLRSLYQTIQTWLDNLTTSDLAPVQSEASWINRYNEMLAKATSPGAEAATINDYLNYATQFLQYQKSFGSSESYQSIYDAVISDVLAIQAQTGERLGSYATGTNYVPQTGMYELHRGEAVIPAHRNGSQSLDTDKLGKAIAKYIMQSNGGTTGEFTVNVPVTIDGREIGKVTAKQIKTNPDLQESIRRVH